MCAYSKVIYASCKGIFKVTSDARFRTMELTPGKNSGSSFTINEFPPEVVEKMVEFFYTGTYECTDTPYGPFCVNAWLFCLADKYLIPDLREYALQRYGSIANLNQELQGFLDSVRLAYGEYRGCMNAGLRNVAVRVATTRLQDLFTDETYHEAVLEVAEFVPEFVTDALLEMMRKRNGWDNLRSVATLY